MDPIEKRLDLELWLNSTLIQQQNLLKSQFLDILEKTGNSFPNEEFKHLTPSPRGFKISKGNDLQGYPYQVLDLIRDFDDHQGVNIRLLNWFGNGLFLTVLLGGKWPNPVEDFLQEDFRFGKIESKWDYADLILKDQLSSNAMEIRAANIGFHHWIKKINPSHHIDELRDQLKNELKKILFILNSTAKEVRN